MSACTTMTNDDDKQNVATNFVHILEDHGENLRNQLYQQWLRGEHCDLVIKFKDGEINVHSAVLFAVSPTLEELPKKKPIRYLNMPDMELSDLDPLIKMAYTGVLCVDMQYAEGVAMAARRLGMKDICLAIRGYLDKYQKNPSNGPIIVSSQKLDYGDKSAENSIKRNEKAFHKTRQMKNKVRKLNLGKKRLHRKEMKGRKYSNKKIPLKSYGDGESIQNGDSVTEKDSDESIPSLQKEIKREEDVEADEYSTMESHSGKTAEDFDESGSETEDYDEDSTSGVEMMVDDTDPEYKPTSYVSKTLYGNKDRVIDLGEMKFEGVAMTSPKLAFLGRRSKSKRRRRNEQGKLKCPGCDAVFDAEVDLKKHVQSEEAHMLFRCPECELSYIRKSNLTRHMRTAHSKEFHLKCRYCDSVANTEKGLREHCRTRHNNPNPFECDEPNCTYKTYKYDFLRRHLQIHNTNREFVCDKCGKTFSQHAGLASHRRTCYQLQEYLCDFCGQAFNHIQSMKSHRRTIHLGERPFMCSECGSRFTDHRNLKRHKRIHENSFPYSCEICGQKYRHSNSLKGHMKRHGDSFLHHGISSKQDGKESVDSRAAENSASGNLSFPNLYSQTFTPKPQEMLEAQYQTKTSVDHTNLSFNSRVAELSSHKYPNDSEIPAPKYPTDADIHMQLNFNKHQELPSHEFRHNPDANPHGDYNKDSELPPHLYIPLYRAKSNNDCTTDISQTDEYSSVQNQSQNSELGDLADLCMTSNL
ncbi:zinc finger protein 492-like [Gigantopelta aegis]|uniref:zinc finger protein 492-like n=1 Tax=Gigantopelta aegis TaxID=1735272 RepID=UPI001B88E32B|nr:zinc finger protein 492-like [Gigantopelta aegis]